MNQFPEIFKGHYEFLLREVLESIDDVVLVFDQHEKVVFANAGACEAFGMDVDTVRGKHLELLSPDDGRSHFMHTVENLSISEHHSVELRGTNNFVGLRADGRTFYAEGKLAKLDGALSYILVLRDITWKKALETELEKALLHLRKYSNKVKERVENLSILEEFPQD